MSQTIALLKPDAVERNLIGSILVRAEACGLRIKALRMVTAPTEAEAAEFYAGHSERGYFRELVRFTTSGPLVVVVFGGLERGIMDPLARWRYLMGPAEHSKRQSHQIRGSWAMETPNPRNLVHGSDSPEEYQRERDVVTWAGWLDERDFV